MIYLSLLDHYDQPFKQLNLAHRYAAFLKRTNDMISASCVITHDFISHLNIS